MTSALALRHVSKTYGSGPSEVHALVDVELVVERGELVAVMGPSGSGKSTLLTIAGSLEEPTGGEVLVDGVDLATASRSDRAKMRRRFIGYVFQDFNLCPRSRRSRTSRCPSSSTASRRRRRARRDSKRSTSSTSPSTLTAIPTSSPAASANGSRSRARSSVNAGFCSRTSRPARSTR